jgi:lipopolysaccharide/colanic/teichoic acid biosynthesis glycosyltransferase
MANTFTLHDTGSPVIIFRLMNFLFWLLLVVVFCLLAFVLERILAIFSISRKHRQRLAFLLSLGFAVIGLIIWQVLVGLQPGTPSPAYFAVLLSGWLGALVGGLLVTGIQDGFWEDNAPPSAQLQSEVIQFHTRVIGVPRKTPLPKRVFDVIVSMAGLILSAPIWLLAIFLIWIEDPGPILFVKNSTGKGGRNFRQFKLRTMIVGAEENTGPVMAREKDIRTLLCGRLLRKTALDELPQLVNIMRGEMSVVGPRPQRTVLVHAYLQEMPEYAERHRVLPGLAGLAQVAGSYYLTPRQKLRFDRLYIQHMGLGYDLRLLLAAFLITFWYRWGKNWDGHLPRKLLHPGNTLQN